MGVKKVTVWSGYTGTPDGEDDRETEVLRDAADARGYKKERKRA